jgi:hypothetical protein
MKPVLSGLLKMRIHAKQQANKQRGAASQLATGNLLMFAQM